MKTAYWTIVIGTKTSDEDKGVGMRKHFDWQVKNARTAHKSW